MNWFKTSSTHGSVSVSPLTHVMKIKQMGICVILLTIFFNLLIHANNCSAAIVFILSSSGFNTLSGLYFCWQHILIWFFICSLSTIFLILCHISSAFLAEADHNLQPLSCPGCTCYHMTIYYFQFSHLVHFRGHL